MTSRTVSCLATLLIAIVIVDDPSHLAAAKGAGRAFPIAAENFAIDSFQRINPSLEWDATNFLVDLSGHFAHCKHIQMPPGVVRISRFTPRGETVVGVVDYTEGRYSDSESVTGYIQTIIRRWENSNQYYNQLKVANVVGCSVRPGCINNAVVACVFSPGHDAVPPRPTYIPTVRPTEAPIQNPTAPPEPIWGLQRALAFTTQQYYQAESVFGRKWDHSHYLENLSGYETDCSMIGTSDWSFTHMKQASIPNVRMVGQYGVARNRGSTPAALQEIIAKFKPIYNSREIGCSLIADCIYPRDNQMYVVVSCLFEENSHRRIRYR